jgi:hypothetical protein
MTTTGILCFSWATTGGKTTGNCFTNWSVSSDDAMTKVDHPDTQLTDETAAAIRCFEGVMQALGFKELRWSPEVLPLLVPHCRHRLRSL